MAERIAGRPRGATSQVTPLSWMVGWLVGWLAGHICRMKSDVHGAGRRPRAGNVLRKASVQRFQEVTWLTALHTLPPAKLYDSTFPSNVEIFWHAT